MTRSTIQFLLFGALFTACAGDGSKPDGDSSGTDTGEQDSGAEDSDSGDSGPDTDRDGDGYDDFGAGGTDCDDGDDSINPGATELCDGVDNDCDGELDEPDSADATPWYADADGDDYGDATDAGTLACEAPEGSVADHTDCDDGDASIHPGATEVCDADDRDEDCDGAADDDDSDVDSTTMSTWYTDADGDNYGDAAGTGTLACDADGVADASDCDDADAWTYPGATELCDDTQNDCDDTGWRSDEGLASLYDESVGTWTDMSALLGSGSSGTPASYTIDDGDSLSLCTGTWYLSLDFAGSGELVGYGKDVILDGGNSVRLIDAQTYAADVSLSNVFLQSGTATSGSGGCLRAEHLNSLTIDSVGVSGCTAGYAGGALFSDISSLTITNLTVESSEATSNNGGGMVVTSVPDFVATDLTISGNTTVGSGGGLLTNGSTTNGTLTGLVLNDNSAPDYGGGWYATAGTYAVSDCELVSNESPSEGGAAEFDGVTITMSDCSFSKNEGPYGGAILLYGAVSFSGDGLSFSDNVGTNGAAMFLASGATAACTDCDFTNNEDGRGALYVQSGSDLTVTTSDFSGNTPYDVYSGGGYSYGTGASFACDGSSCSGS